MQGEINKLYDRAELFFANQGSGVMKLTPDAAIRVSLAAAKNGLLIARVEGGIWHDPGFEARLDCIWDGASPPIDEVGADQNNTDAADFIREESHRHNAFVLTAPPLSGWPNMGATRG